MGSLTHSRTGATLLETVLAFFIIAGAMSIATGLYISSFQGIGEARDTYLLVHIAESKIDELRAKTAIPANFDAITSEAGTAVDPEYGYTVQTEVAPLSVPHPCENLAGPVSFLESFYQVKVTVTSPSGKTYSLSSVIADPPRPVLELVCRRLGPNTELDPNEDTIFEAELLDENSRPIPDIEFQFSISITSGGNATFSFLPSSTNQAILTNEVLTAAGTTLLTGDDVIVMASATYAGQRYEGETPPMDLGTPPP